MKVSGGDCSHGDPCSYDIHALLLLLLPVFLHFNLFFVFFLVCKGEICECSLGAGILPFSILSLTRQRSSHLPPLKNVKFTYPKGGGDLVTCMFYALFLPIFLRGWQRVLAWRVMSPKFARWRGIEPKLFAWRGTGHHNLMRDFLFYKYVACDLQDLLIRFPW